MAWSTGYLLTIDQSGTQMRLFNTTVLAGVYKKGSESFPRW
jgi:hypothetical protein